MSTEGKFVAKGGFQVRAGELKAALKCFKHMITQKVADEILKRVLLHRMGHRLELHGSDGEMYATSFLDVEPIQGTKIDVGVAVPYKELTDYLKQISDKTILKCVCADDEKGIPHLLIESEYGRRAFHGIDSHNYPKAPAFRCINILIMTVGDFRDMLARTTFAADDGVTYPKLNGVYFHCLPDRTRFVATNRYILSMYEKTDLIFTKPESVMVPIKFLRAFANSIESLSEDGKVFIYISDNHILLAHKGFSLFSKCLGADFPDYEKVMSKEAQYVAILERETMINTIERLISFANKRSPRIDFLFDQDRVWLSVENKRLRKIEKESLSCNYIGDIPICFTISFNAKSLLSILENLKSEKVVMKMVSSGRPAVIEPEPQASNAYILCLISPVLVLK